MDADTMQAGCETDVAVAEALGWKRCKVADAPRVPNDDGGWSQVESVFVSPAGEINAVPNFSTDIAAAWLVRDWIIFGGLAYDVTINGRLAIYVEVERPDSTVWFSVEAPTAPLALCRAALRVAKEGGSDGK